MGSQKVAWFGGDKVKQFFFDEGPTKCDLSHKVPLIKVTGPGKVKSMFKRVAQNTFEQTFADEYFRTFEIKERSIG